MYFVDTRLTRVGLLSKYCLQLWNSLSVFLFNLLVVAYGAHVTTTVIPSLAELAFGTVAQATLTATERYTLIGLYLPYLLIPATMVVDSYFKISSMIGSGSSKPKQI